MSSSICNCKHYLLIRCCPINLFFTSFVSLCRLFSFLFLLLSCVWQLSINEHDDDDAGSSDDPVWRRQRRRGWWSTSVGRLCLPRPAVSWNHFRPGHHDRYWTIRKPDTVFGHWVWSCRWLVTCVGFLQHYICSFRWRDKLHLRNLTIQPVIRVHGNPPLRALSDVNGRTYSKSEVVILMKRRMDSPHVRRRWNNSSQNKEDFFGVWFTFEAGITSVETEATEEKNQDTHRLVGGRQDAVSLNMNGDVTHLKSRLPLSKQSQTTIKLNDLLRIAQDRVLWILWNTPPPIFI